MPKKGVYKDLTGMRFGRLSVLWMSGKNKHGNITWFCSCDAPGCGGFLNPTGSDLVAGRSKSCGCLNLENGANKTHIGKTNIRLNLVGQKFNRLTVLEKLGKDIHGKQLWKCECDCSDKTISIVCSSALRRGVIKSCGCYKYEIASAVHLTHGLSDTPEYDAWSSMIKRCYATNNIGYENYGGNGVTVCAEWRAAFLPFYEHIGPRPSSKHSVDRIDPFGNYEPGNVRWATRQQQAQNKRDSVKATYKGITKVVTQWFREFDCGTTQAYRLIKQKGFTWDEVIAYYMERRYKQKLLPDHLRVLYEQPFTDAA